MMERANKCPKCGGQLVYEELHQFGDVYLLGIRGKPLKRRKARIHYFGDGNAMIYCHECGVNYEFKRDLLGIYWLKTDDEGGDN